MTLYNVHIFREMRLFFPGIEATTPGEAVRIAGDKPTPDADYTEDCDGESLLALVDVVGFTIVIKRDAEGIVVDLFPLHVMDEPIASTWALYSEAENAEPTNHKEVL